MTLTIAYFPPVEYFAILAKYSLVYMEACENYQKQSYRNRCRFLASDGVQMLNFPVVHEGGSFNLPIREIKVDYSTPWVRKTQKCIDTAYMSSPFFEYYRDELYSVMDEKPETLWDLDMNIMRFFMDKIGLDTRIVLTESYAPEHMEIHPKKPNSILRDLGVDRTYYQVFMDKFGFQGGLSVMDLLFNEGPESLGILL